MRDGDVAAGSEGDGHVGGGESGGVVCAIADEGDDFADAVDGLEGFDIFGFSVGKDIGADVGGGDAKLEGDAAGGGSVVARAHVDDEVVGVLEGV